MGPLFTYSKQDVQIDCLNFWILNIKPEMGKVDNLSQWPLCQKKGWCTIHKF